MNAPRGIAAMLMVGSLVPSSASAAEPQDMPQVDQGKPAPTVMLTPDEYVDLTRAHNNCIMSPQIYHLIEAQAQLVLDATCADQGGEICLGRNDVPDDVARKVEIKITSPLHPDFIKSLYACSSESDPEKLAQCVTTGLGTATKPKESAYPIEPLRRDSQPKTPFDYDGLSTDLREGPPLIDATDKLAKLYKCLDAEDLTKIHLAEIRRMIEVVAGLAKPNTVKAVAEARSANRRAKRAIAEGLGLNGVELNANGKPARVGDPKGKGDNRGENSEHPEHPEWKGFYFGTK